jgi:hypothetical protein
MADTLLSGRQRAALRGLLQRVAERASAEADAELNFKSRTEAAEAELAETRQRITALFSSEQEAAETEYLAAQQEVTGRFSAEHAAAEKELAAARHKANAQAEQARDEAKSEFEETRWTTNTVLEAARKAAQTQLQKVQRGIAGARQKAQRIQDKADLLLEDWLGPEEPEEPDGADAPGGDDPYQDVQDHITTAEKQLTAIKDDILPGFYRGRRLLWLWVILGLLVAAPLAWLTEEYLWFGLGGVAAVAAGWGLAAWMRTRTVVRVRVAYLPLGQSLARAEAACKRCLAVGEEESKRQLAEAEERYKKDLGRAQKHYHQRKADLKQRQEAELARAAEKYRRLTEDSTARRDRELAQAEEKYRRLSGDSKDRFENDSRRMEEKYSQQREESRLTHQRDWDLLEGRWKQGVAESWSVMRDVDQESGRLFRPWNDPAWGAWTPPTAVPPGIRFGEYQVDLEQIPNGVPTDERLRTDLPARFPLPALLPFPTNGSLLLKASDEGRSAAVQAVQAVMLRLLTAVPPGKVRFTILDSVGLGENFAAFMHLADYDEALVTSRIWTEQQHIEQRLADLTEHMENVIQKYLRNQYQSIEEYNAQAGEVAEPFRVLVVANFPVNFSAEAARRLISIAGSGARCGVYTLITVDTKQPLPEGIDRADLEQAGVILAWKDKRFAWQDPDVEKFPLTVDAPPDADFCTRILQKVGQNAKHANRVEVPFEFIAPAPEQWWTRDSRPGIDVPLGRAGATKRQHLQLGKGTAQHVLVAGKTGSGKSTLLHALITNLSLFYSPEEVELYLIDFKKGVEFKTYATHELPHARVIAVESEREFGLSVLQRLDAELKQRGNRFRELGVQDLAGYRQATGNAPCPRILLIVDEFQEFFVEDDKIAQEATLLLDRLVRQGRAFGLHVLLGSQTLGGAYSLARSTIDQMAVRIALQCSESDAHYILGKDNSAARLLSRPGEAIYNDANGQLEGNDIFQVVWLPDERREVYLRRVQELARQRRQTAAQPPIVFEGNVPADVAKNPHLNRLLREPVWPAPPRSAQAWLGEAIAIKDPTAALFRPQTGSNVLMLGQQEEAALGIQATSLVSLAAQYAPGSENGIAGVRFYIIDGSPADAPHAGYLAALAEVLPHPVTVVAWRDLPAAFAELAQEVDRRQKAGENDGPAVYLFLYGLQRFRELRKQDDDFGFSRRGGEQPASPAKQFTTILREGPALGVYTVLWCDSLNNLNRCLDRQGLREFEMRVLFQMGVADSSTLIDSPLASKLGLHRALYFSEEQGRLEKFRPYGLPSDEWLGWVREQFAGKKLPHQAGQACPAT